MFRLELKPSGPGSMRPASIESLHRVASVLMMDDEGNWFTTVAAREGWMGVPLSGTVHPFPLEPLDSIRDVVEEFLSESPDNKAYICFSPEEMSGVFFRKEIRLMKKGKK